MRRFVHVMSIAAVLVAFSFSASAQNDVGVSAYPNSTEMTEATKRLLETKAAIWIAARVYRTDDSIKDVVKYFRQQADKAKKPASENEYVRRLLQDNWRIADGTIRGSHVVFGASKDLRDTSKKEAKNSFGTILLDDSFVRVHVLSPYPASATEMTVAKGTMIVLIRERMPEGAQISASSDVDEPVYTGRDVTRRVRILSKPEPQYPGVRGLVVLKAVFGSSGRVTKIEVVQGVAGLTEEAVKAARQIRFEPAIKDGRYVAQWLQLEYNFF